MKIYIVDIEDGNGCRLLPYLDRDKALEAAQDWFKTKPGVAFNPGLEEWLGDCMDSLMDGEQVVLSNTDRIQLREAELDVSGIVDVMEDAQHTLGKLSTLVNKLGLPMTDGVDRAISSFHTSDQALHLTLLKLKGRP